MEFKDYKEKQKYYKKMNKERGSWLWMSKEKGDVKGRTYNKRREEFLKFAKEQLDKKEK